MLPQTLCKFDKEKLISFVIYIEYCNDADILVP